MFLGCSHRYQTSLEPCSIVTLRHHRIRRNTVRANAFREPGSIRQFKSFTFAPLTQWSKWAPQRPIPWSHSVRVRALFHGRLRMHVICCVLHAELQGIALSLRRDGVVSSARFFCLAHTLAPGRYQFSPSPDRDQRHLCSPELREAEHMQTSHSPHPDRLLRPYLGVPRAPINASLFALIGAAGPYNCRSPSSFKFGRRRMYKTSFRELAKSANQTYEIS